MNGWVRLFAALVLGLSVDIKFVLGSSVLEWMHKARRSGGQTASLASTTKMHLAVMNLPTNDRDWLPLAANPREWWKLINKKPHQVLSGPAAPATKHGL